MVVKIKLFLIAVLLLVVLLSVVVVHDQIALSGNEVWHVLRCLQVLVIRVRLLL